jgi:hypothetical protein
MITLVLPVTRGSPKTVGPPNEFRAGCNETDQIPLPCQIGVVAAAPGRSPMPSVLGLFICTMRPNAVQP